MIERNASSLIENARVLDHRLLALAALWELLNTQSRAHDHARVSTEPSSPWHRRDGWRLNEDNHQVLVFHFAEQRHAVTVHYRVDEFELALGGRLLRAAGTIEADGSMTAQLNGVRCRASVIPRGDVLAVFALGESCILLRERPAHAHDDDGLGSLVSPLPGNVIQLLVRAGELVTKGQALMIIEAMKMEHTIVAPAAGTVTQIYFARAIR